VPKLFFLFMAAWRPRDGLVGSSTQTV